MIITLKGCTATKHLGGLNFYSIIVNKSSGITVTLDKTTVSKDTAASATVSGTLTVSSGYTLSSVKIMMGGVDYTSSWYNSSTGDITISGITANVTITAVATNNATGETDAPSGGGSSEDDNITGYTQQEISYDENDWALSTIGTSGLSSISDGSSDIRLSYTKTFTIPESRIIKVICDSAYTWACRNGTSDSSMANNQYWYSTGTDLSVIASSGGKMALIIRKNSTTESTDGKTTTITKADAAASKIKLYFKNS